MREVWIDMTWASKHIPKLDGTYSSDNVIVYKFFIDDNEHYNYDDVRVSRFSSREEALLKCEIACAEFKEFQYQTIRYDANFIIDLLCFKCSWPEIESHFAIELSPKLKESLIS